LLGQPIGSANRGGGSWSGRPPGGGAVCCCCLRRVVGLPCGHRGRLALCELPPLPAYAALCLRGDSCRPTTLLLCLVSRTSCAAACCPLARTPPLLQCPSSAAPHRPPPRPSKPNAHQPLRPRISIGQCLVTRMVWRHCRLQREGGKWEEPRGNSVNCLPSSALRQTASDPSGAGRLGIIRPQNTPWRGHTRPPRSSPNS
jgi:hypothetical protein